MKLKQISFKLVSMVMVIAMMFGLCATTISATVAGVADAKSSETTKGTLNYVSVGDSMTNGYGFEGYNQDEHFDRVGKDDTYNYFTGENVYGEGSYANQFADWLADSTGKEVNHIKLALSGLRVENVAFLLGVADDLVDGDDTYWDYAWLGGNFEAGTSNGSEGYNGIKDTDYGRAQLAQMQNYFQESFKNADVISLALGNASFNNYVQKALFKIMNVFGDDFDEENPQVGLEDALALVENEKARELVLQVYDMVMAELLAVVPADLASFKVDEICDLIAYVTASFAIHYIAVLEWIAENNPDADVILLGILNSNAGWKIDGGDQFGTVDLGGVLDKAYEAIGAYVAALPALMRAQGQAKDVEFFYVDQPENPEMISAAISDLVDAGWTNVDKGRLEAKIIRIKTIDAYHEYIVSNSGGQLAKIDYSDVKKVEDAAAGSTIYDLVVAWVMEDPATRGADAAGQGAYGMKMASAIVYLALEKAVVESLKTPNSDEVNLTLTMSGIEAFADGTIMKIFGEMPAHVFGDIEGTTIETQLEAFTDFFVNGPAQIKVGENMVDLDPTIMLNLVRIFSMLTVGNGISAHPTPATHDRIAANMIAAYENEHYAEIETIENAIEALQWIVEYLGENYEEAYGYAYMALEKLGYIETAEQYLEIALEAVEDLAAEVEALDLDASLDDLKADLVAAINAVAEDIVIVNDVLNSATHSGAVENLNKLLNKLSGHVEDVLELCDDVIAVADAHARATIEAVKVRFEELDFNVDTFAGELAQKAYDYLVEKHEGLKEAYAQFVEYVGDSIAAYSPATAWRVEELLNAVPGLVHAFFAEYGDEILAFVVENTVAFAKTVALFAQECGEKLVELIVDAAEALADGAESLFTIVVEWSVKYGTLAYEFAKAYIAALDLGFSLDVDEVEAYLTERFEDVLDLVEKIVDMIKSGDIDVDVIYQDVKVIKDYAEDIAAYLEGCAEITLEDLKNNKNTLVSALTTDLGKAIEKLEAQIKDIEIELNEELAELEAAANAQIDKLVEIAEEEDVEGKITEILNNLEKDAKALRDQAEKQIVILEGKIQDQIDEFNANREENIEKLVKCVTTKLENAIKAIDQYIFENYSVVDIELNNKSDLVSIGGQNSVIYTDKKGNLVVDDHYASILAGMFEGGLNVEILHDNNLRVSDLLAILDKNYVADEYGKAVLAGVDAEAYLAAIDAAELITLDFGVEDFTSFVFAQVLGFVYENYSEDFSAVLNELAGIELGNVVGEHKTYEMDWSRFGVIINQDVADYISSYAYDLIVEQGVPTEVAIGDAVINVVEIAAFAVESLLYAVVNYSYNLEAAIEAIHAINPDAAVMVLGSFNFLDDIKIPALAELGIDLGAIADVIVKVVDLQTLANVANMDNTYYVYVGGAETVIESGEDFTYLNLININEGVVSFNSDLLDASEAGHKYIAEQLFAAITGKYTVLPPCQHEYDDCEDVDCNLCGEIRRAPGHTYEYCTDDKCAVCGKDIEPTEHEYSNCTDTSCYKCKYVRKAGAHTYDGCLDTDCNVCGFKRVAAHTYKEVCSEKCMLCSHTRVTKHTFGEWVVTKEAKNGRTVGEQMRTCEICGKTETRSLAFVGLGGGAIAAIISGSVVVAGAGGFSVFWFVVKKKSFADLVGVFKSLTKKAQ